MRSNGSSSMDDEDLQIESSSTMAATPIVMKKVGGKANVAAACGPCKKAHLACDVARPCKRCVNMGKSHACADVPHKKRGRPKTVRPQIESAGPLERIFPPALPLHTGRSHTVSGSSKSWRGYGSGIEHRMSNSGRDHDHFQAHRGLLRPPVAPLDSVPYYSRTRLSSGEASPEYEHGSAYSISPTTTTSGHGVFQSSAPPVPTLFTLFASTSLQIVRATAECQSLTGYLPHEYINLSLYHYLHPDDVPVVESDRVALTQSPRLPSALHSQRETLAAMSATPHFTTGQRARTERELLSPAEGMAQPYPNRNVRVLRADGEYDLYNVRLHVGGGLGASLWRPETFGRSYIVISMLRLPADVAAKFHRPNRRFLSASKPGPPVPPSAAVNGHSGHPQSSSSNTQTLSPLFFDHRESLTISPIDSQMPTAAAVTNLPSFSSIAGTVAPQPQMVRSLSGPGGHGLGMGPKRERLARDDQGVIYSSSHSSLPLSSGMVAYRTSNSRQHQPSQTPLASVSASLNQGQSQRPESGSSHVDWHHSDSRSTREHEDDGGCPIRSAPLPFIDHGVRESVSSSVSAASASDTEMRSAPAESVTDPESRQTVETVRSPKRDPKRIWE